MWTGQEVTSACPLSGRRECQMRIWVAAASSHVIPSGKTGPTGASWSTVGSILT